MSEWSILFVEVIRVPGENYRPAASHWQTFSHNRLLQVHVTMSCKKGQNSTSRNVVEDTIENDSSCDMPAFKHRWNLQYWHLLRDPRESLHCFLARHGLYTKLFFIVLLKNPYIKYKQPYFSYIVAVNFIDGGNRCTCRKPLTCCKSLTNFYNLFKNFIYS
jgi:hypothetical protein